MTTSLANAVRKTWGVRARPRYLRFLAQEQYEELAYLNLRSGFVEGCYLPQFADSRKLRDVEHLARSAGVESLDRLMWEAEFEHFLPLAALVPASRGESSRDVGAFLVLGIYADCCPVFVLVREGHMLVPLASSLNDFTSGKAWAGPPSLTHRRMGQPYESFGWSSTPLPLAYQAHA